MAHAGRILITGGTGLVGAPITELLLQAGFHVLLFSRTCPLSLRNHPHLTWQPADLTDNPQPLLEGLSNVYAVVHAAAAIADRQDVTALDEMVRLNIGATQNLLEWSVQSRVHRFVLISSLSVLRRPFRQPIQESDPIGPCTVYGVTKWVAEELVMRFAAQSDLVPLVLRIASPIPSSFEFLPRTVVRTWIEAARNRKPLQVFGSGQRSQDFVSCSDVAAAVLAALNMPSARGIYHIGSGQSLAMLDLAQIIAEVMQAEVVTNGTDPNEFDRCVLSLQRAASELNYIPQISGSDAIRRLAVDLL
jgi:UDP-glucose 4-epimerase